VTVPATERVAVALDGGPLLGAITGIGAAVQQIVTALGERDDLSLSTYALSFRGQLPPGMTRLPLPALVAHRLWAHADHPRLDRWLRPAQVVHGTNYVVPPSALPRLVSVYDCWFLRNTEHASGDVARAGRVLRRAVAGGAMVHASSHATARAVREILGAERVEVIPLAALPVVGSGRSTPIAELRDAPFIVSIGTLERRKNIPRLVRAFGAIAPAHQSLRLVLAGADGDDRRDIDTAIDELPNGTSARIVRTGRIDDDVKCWLLTHARMLAYASLDEGFGFPLLEAMQHDLPVVASTRGSIPEVAGDAAILVDADDTDALAHALETVLTDESTRQRLVQNGRARVAAFSWADTADQLAGLYHRLAQEGT
jgi:glycosyltransferase involved in cell wall biosynthesis